MAWKKPVTKFEVLNYECYEDFKKEYEEQSKTYISMELSWIKSCIAVRAQIDGCKLTDDNANKYFKIYKNKCRLDEIILNDGDYMINKIMNLLNSEQKEIYDNNKEKENLAFVELKNWARSKAVNNVAIIEDNEVINKFIELIQTDLKETKELPKNEHQEIKPETKELPKNEHQEIKPPKKKDVKTFKVDMQNAFNFDIPEADVSKPIWEL